MEGNGVKERGTFHFNGRCPSQSGREREREREKKVKKDNAAVVLVVRRSLRIAHLGRFGRVHPGRPWWACAGVAAGGGAANGKCEHKIRQMKTNCAAAAASFVRSRSFGPLRERERGRERERQTTSLRCHESEVRRCSEKKA